MTDRFQARPGDTVEFITIDGEIDFGLTPSGQARCAFSFAVNDRSDTARDFIVSHLGLPSWSAVEKLLSEHSDDHCVSILEHAIMARAGGRTSS